MADDEIIAFSIFGLVAAVPLFAVSVVAHRLRRGRWWVAAPWLLLAALATLGAQMAYSARMFGPESDPAVTWMIIGLFSAWPSTTIFLIALLIAGPKLPPSATVGRR